LFLVFADFGVCKIFTAQLLTSVEIVAMLKMA